MILTPYATDVWGLSKQREVLDQVSKIVPLQDEKKNSKNAVAGGGVLCFSRST